jgi:hypothetical protein
MANRDRKPSALRGTRKARKTFTLSRKAVDFLEAEKRRRGRRSASMVLEEIIDDQRRRGHPSNVDATISAYYDSLSEEEREENRRWGEFAESQFPSD